ADALNRLQQPKPLTFDFGAKTEQPDLIFADMRFDREHGGLTDAWQFLQRARRAMHLVADTVDVDDDGILAVGFDQAFELADHALIQKNSSSFRGRAKRGARNP